MRTVVVWWAVFAATCLRPAVAATDALSLLPEDTCAALIVDDMPRLAASWRATELGKLITGGALAEVRADLESRDAASPLRLRPWFGVDWCDLEKAPGEVALAVFPVEAGSFATVCLIDAARDRGPAQACLDSAAGYFSAHSYTRQTVMEGEVELVVLRPPAGRPPAAPTMGFVSPRYLVVASDLAGAKRVISCLKSPQPRTLAGKPLLVQATAPAPGSVQTAVGCLRWYVEPLPLAKLLQPAGNAQERDSLGAAERLGASALRAVSGTVQCRSGKADIEFQARIVAPKPYPGAMGLLDFPPGELPIPSAWFGRDVDVVAQWRWDFPAALRALGHLFDEWTEPGKAGQGLFQDMLDGLRDDPEGPQVDLRKDFFDLLGPGVTQVRDSAGEPTTASPLGKRILYEVQCRDPARAARTLERFYGRDPQVKTTSIDGRKVWHVQGNHSLFVEAETQEMLKLQAISVREETVLIASDLGLLRATIERPGNQETAKQYQAVNDWLRQVAPGDACLRRYALPDRRLKSPYLALQRNKAENAGFETALLRWAFFGDAEELPEAALRKLPDFDRIRHGLLPTGFVLLPDEEGWMLRGGCVSVPTAK